MRKVKAYINMEFQMTARLVKFVCKFAICGSLCVGVPTAGAIPLGTLINTGGSIDVGNLRFDNFGSFVSSSVVQGSASPLDLDDIEVTGTTVLGQFGLRFFGPFSAIETNGIQAYGHYGFDYTVTSLTSQNLIDGFGHTFDLVVEGWGSGKVVTRTNTLPGDEPFLQLVTPPPPFPTTSGVTIESGKLKNLIAQQLVALPTLTVLESFTLSSGNFVGSFPINGAEFDYVDVFFSQIAIPEPATFALLGLGLAGIGYQRRKQVKVA